jgi:hypothetical protein
VSGEVERRGETPCQCGQVSFDHGRSYHDRHREIVTAEQARTRHQNYDGTDAHCAARKAGELDPEWVMCGVDVPAGKRLYASKDLKGSAFALAMDQHGNGDGWHLTSTMCHMLVITKPTYAECMAELMRIWANWDGEGRALPPGQRDVPAMRAIRRTG